MLVILSMDVEKEMELIIILMEDNGLDNGKMTCKMVLVAI